MVVRIIDACGNDPDPFEAVQVAYQTVLAGMIAMQVAADIPDPTDMLEKAWAYAGEQAVEIRKRAAMKSMQTGKNNT